MIPVHRGRGGWGNSMRAVGRVAAVVLLSGAVALAFGCSSQQKTPASGTGAGGPGSGLGENGVGPGGGSLEQLKNGTLGKNGQQGPLGDIHFGFNEYTVETQDGDVLRENAKWLEGHPNTRVQIEGHCDDRGSEEYNIALGAKRAQAAKDYLQTLGIAADRMSTISYGKELPICTEETDDCWAQNRRDHFVVLQ